MKLMIGKEPLAVFKFNAVGFVKDFSGGDFEFSVKNNLKVIKGDDKFLDVVYWSVDWANLFRVKDLSVEGKTEFVVFGCEYEDLVRYVPKVYDKKSFVFDFSGYKKSSEDLIVFDSDNPCFDAQIEFSLGSTLVDWVDNKWVIK